MKINTVIIDDEPLAIDIIKKYCESINDIELIATFTNPIEAMKFINSNRVDLLFLDIEMPILTGLEFIETLNTKPSLIFTTAYPQFAIDAFEFDAVDYLVKPVSYKRFLKAVNKLNKNTSEILPSEQAIDYKIPSRFIFVKSDYESVKIVIEDIKYIEGLKDYLKIHLTNNRYVLTLSNFKNLMEKLPDNLFIRVHNSFVVNLKYVEVIQRNKIIIDNQRIPISGTYKNKFFEKIKL
ncbi:LytTR family DNA-binding domain-containing protein [Flavobacterium sp.]|uniref:LytR/AlgR family response regulator transcription factor n=1 Tax=Flavobacterium sp. TaxID=239 RepID=UPI0026225928|nr:LytTR family DNA-binding domain-containing protein [Flavobacterium sp.]